MPGRASEAAGTQQLPTTRVRGLLPLTPKLTKGSENGGEGARTLGLPVETPGKTAIRAVGGTESGTVPAHGPVDPVLATVVDAWPTLPEAIRAAILAIVRQAAAGAG